MTTITLTAPPRNQWDRMKPILIVLAVAAVLGALLMITRPRAKRQPPPVMTPVVEVVGVTPISQPVVLEAMGTVLPAREVRLQAEISGRIVAVHSALSEGGFVQAGDALVTLDDTLYRAAAQRQEAALRTAESNARLEEGQQAVARLDWELMKEELDPTRMDEALALREPQRETARAAVAAARASLEEAAYNLARTRIAAPFDAVVLSADAEVGGQAAPGALLARLVDAATYWVQAAVPVRDLRWIRFPTATEPGSAVTLTLPDGRTRDGTVLRHLADLEPQSRMARVLIAVTDPLGRKTADSDTPAAPLLINDYVRLDIHGTTLKDVCPIPRAALRDGSEIWLLDADHRLQIHPVTVIWGNRDYVLVRTDWPADWHLVVSDLVTPVAGMSLRVVGEDTATERTPGEDAAP